MHEDKTRKYINEWMHYRWDPAGLEFVDGDELDEYSPYVEGLYVLLNRGSGVSNVFDYLWEIETISMGLDGDYERTENLAHALVDMCSGH